VIPGTPRRDTDIDVACDWDAYGITLLTKNGLADTFESHINLKPFHRLATEYPDSAHLPPLTDPRPKNPFRGYLELDGYE
jgi:hypothetical protein